MALSNDIQALPMPGWPGGLNREADQATVPIEESPDALNVNFGANGSARRRKGYATRSTGIASKTGGHVISWLGKLLVAAAEGDILTVSGTTTTDSTYDLGTGPFTGRSYRTASAAMNDFLYVTRNATATPVKWDGTTVSQVTAADFDGTAARFPRARTLTHLHERFFAGNVQTSAGTAHPSRLYFSDALDPEMWTALGYIEVAPDNGTEITRITPFGDSVLVFKETSLYLLSGVDANSFTLFPIDPEVGTTAPDSVVVDGGRVFFLDARRGVLLFDGESFSRISDKINTYLLDGMNIAAVEKVSAFKNKGRYYLSVPWGSDTLPSRTFVFDEINGSWTEYDYGFTSAATDVSPIRGRLPSLIDTFTLESGNTDDGAVITAYVKSAWFSPAGFGNQHRLRRMDLSFSLESLSSVTIEMSRDYQRERLFTQVVTVDPQSSLWGTMEWGTDSWGAGLEEALRRLSGWGSKRWRAAQLKFITTDDIELSRVMLELSVHWRVRGEN